ncbi:MAG: VOC family protein [Flavobacteriaceae bacterium]
MKKVTGIGGIFFKCKNPKKIKDWYASNLGLVVDAYGATFETRDSNNPKQINYTQWSPFKDDTDYFEPSKKAFMVNYRVENIEVLVAELKKSGVTVLDKIESFDYGKFVHILDPEGNKIELWEPVDQVFTDILKGNMIK